MHLVDIGSTIISFKPLLNRIVPYQYDLGTFTLDHHLTQTITLPRRCGIAQFTLSCPSLAQVIMTVIITLFLGARHLVGCRPHFQLGQVSDTN